MQIGRRLTEVTTDPRETAVFFQRLFVSETPSNDSMRPACAQQTRPQFPSPHRDLNRRFHSCLNNSAIWTELSAMGWRNLIHYLN